jgi:hypothetical protein
MKNVILGQPIFPDACPDVNHVTLVDQILRLHCVA